MKHLLAVPIIVALGLFALCNLMLPIMAMRQPPTTFIFWLGAGQLAGYVSILAFCAVMYLTPADDEFPACNLAHPVDPAE